MKAASRVLTEEWARFELISPNSDKFRVYGGDDVVERARAWALDCHYLLVSGLPACAHGLYLMQSCPHDRCQNEFRQLDHASLWVPDPVLYRPFLLTHPYADTIDKETELYAAAHGLDLDAYVHENWYGNGTIPIRLSLPSGWPVWSIEKAAIVMLVTQPVAWPKESP